MRAIESGSRSRSTSVPRSPSVSGRPPRWATTTSAKRFGSRTRPSTRRIASCIASVSRPTGWSALASRSAATISAGVIAVGAQARRVEVDAHLAHRQAADVDPGHALDALQPLADDLLAEDRQLARAARLATAAPASTTGWALSLLKRATVGALASRGKRGLHRGDAVAHVLHRAAHVGVERELDARLAAALEAARGDALDAGDAVERLLDRLGHLALDRLGRRARVGDVDEGDRRRDVGHLLDAQLAVREQAEHAQRHHHHGRRRPGC